jgi:hypothetical protein
VKNCRVTVHNGIRFYLARTQTKPTKQIRKALMHKQSTTPNRISSQGLVGMIARKKRLRRSKWLAIFVVMQDVKQKPCQVQTA